MWNGKNANNKQYTVACDDCFIRECLVALY